MSLLIYMVIVHREEIEKQQAHERYMRLQEQGKTDQAKKDLGNITEQCSSNRLNLFCLELSGLVVLSLYLIDCLRCWVDGLRFLSSEPNFILKSNFNCLVT